MTFFQVSGLTRVAPDGELIVGGVEFSLEAGQVLWVVGPSGSGKSSLLRAVVGLDSGVQGQVLLNGASPGDMGITLFRRLVIYQRQEPARFTGTLGSHLDLLNTLKVNRGKKGRSPDQLKVNKLQAPGVSAIACDLLLPPDIMDREFKVLSGGECQRVALALNLACDPRVLLLDEPFSGLDIPARKRALRLLDQWVGGVGVGLAPSGTTREHQGRGAVIVSHDLPREGEMDCPQQYLVMDGGEAVLTTGDQGEAVEELERLRQHD